MAVGVAVIAGMLFFMGHGDVSRYLISAYSGLVALGLLVGMLKDVVRGKYGVDILAVVAIISTILVGEYWAAIVIVIMMLGGEALEDYAAKRAKSELSALLDRVPKLAHKQMIDGSLQDVPVDDIKAKDLIVIKPGEVVPVDGTVIMGNSSLDESSLTGESAPIDVREGDRILSGAVNGQSPLVVRTEKIAKDSEYAQIVQLVQAATGEKAPFVRLADRYAVPFTALAFLLGGVAWWLSGDARRFAEVLVVATPCPLLLAAPVAMISGMSRAAKNGVIIKNGGVLEKLALVRAVAFDKTGTLTNGTLVFAAIQPAPGVDESDVFKLALGAEQSSAHVTALAIIAEAKNRGIAIPKATHVKEVAGSGIACRINNRQILAGKRKFLLEQGVGASEVPDYEGMATYIAQGKKYMGLLTYADTIREDSDETLKSLIKLGIERFVMITGDREFTARKIAKKLRISDVHANCLPQDKLAVVKGFPVRPIAMIGDGVNDAPVLAASDVGIAMGARGASAASESADVVIMVDALSRVPIAISVARRTLSIAKQSVWLGIAISVGLMVIASIGLLPAVAGAMLQEVVDVAVIINALRAHSDARKMV